MRVLIIRHAESANNVLAQGTEYDAYMQRRSADPGITELGFAQSKLLTEHLVGDGTPPPDAPDNGKGAYGITHLYCSPMLRSLQTAYPIAQALDLPLSIWKDIHEHGGMFTGNPRTGENLVIDPGLTRRAIHKEFPGVVLPDAVTERGWWQGGYEDMPACYGRAVRVARDLHRRATREYAEGMRSILALVSHGTYMDALLKALFSAVPDRGHYYHHTNTAITRVDFNENGTLSLRYHNRTNHLTRETGAEGRRIVTL